MLKARDQVKNVAYTLLIIAFVEHNHQLTVNHHSTRMDFLRPDHDSYITRPATAPLRGASSAVLFFSVEFLSCEGRSFELFFFFFLFDGC